MSVIEVTASIIFEAIETEMRNEKEIKYAYKFKGLKLREYAAEYF